jgi:hypothetical protein
MQQLIEPLDLFRGDPHNRLVSRWKHGVPEWIPEQPRIPSVPRKGRLLAIVAIPRRPGLHLLTTTTNSMMEGYKAPLKSHGLFREARHRAPMESPPRNL